MSTIYQSQYFTNDGQLAIPNFRLFLNALQQIKESKDSKEQTELFNQMTDFVNMFDCPTTTASAKELIVKFLEENPEINIKFSEDEITGREDDSTVEEDLEEETDNQEEEIIEE